MVFFCNTLALSMIQRLLVIWSLVLLPFLNPAGTTKSTWFTYCWNLTWRILSTTLLACEIRCICTIVWIFFITIRFSPQQGYDPWRDWILYAKAKNYLNDKVCIFKFQRHSYSYSVLLHMNWWYRYKPMIFYLFKKCTFLDLSFWAWCSKRNCIHLPTF